MSGPLIAVPVWGRLDLLERCLRSIDAGTSPEVELLVLDDRGPQSPTDTDLWRWLGPQRRWRLVANPRNLGFVATANRAFGLAAGRDVVLVNSDVAVYPGWLDGLREAMTPVAPGSRVASASALATDASILTVPLDDSDGDLAALAARAPAALAARLRTLGPGDPPPVSAPIPVAVAHCVYFSGAALAQVGRFDLAFSPGYGEEVDWSLRARRLGWHHVAALRTYVLHDAGSSFAAATGRRGLLRRRHEARLALRYPLDVAAIRRRAHDDSTPLARGLAAVAALAAAPTESGAADASAPPAADASVPAAVAVAAAVAAAQGAALRSARTGALVAIQYGRGRAGKVMNRIRAGRSRAMPTIAADADDQWLETLIEGLERGVEGVPSGPPPEVQSRFVGWSGEAALRECYPFYRLVKDAVGSPLEQAQILDFGVGWGRLIRFFAREADPAHLYGVDVDRDILAVCADTGVPGDLRPVDPTGSLPYADGSFDLAYAYSVFSHLAEDSAQHWFAELGRTVRPGGLLALTTQGARFLDLCRAVRDKSRREGFEEVIDGFFADPHQALRTYKAGEFVYAPTGGGGVLTADFYGWAAIPCTWLERLPDFTVERVVDDPAVNEQVVFLLRRR